MEKKRKKKEKEKGKKKKKERGMVRKIWRGWIKWKINKVQGCWETKLPFFFPTMCNPTMRTSLVPRSLIFFCPCRCTPFYIFFSLTSLHYGLILMIIGFER
jgi:hypothetical protein